MRLALLLLVGCGRVAFDPQSDGGSATSDSTVIPSGAWGDYAATLPVPECAGAELLVTDTTDSLDGGSAIADPAAAGPTLSFVEAITIANNRAGYDTVRFDATVFPVDTPATIVIGAAATTPGDITNTCVDGRRRGVIVDWEQCATVACPPGLYDRSTLIGLTYIHTQFEMVVNDSQVAGVRFGTDGIQNLARGRPWAIEVVGTSGTALVGPGNVVTGMVYAFRVFGGDTFTQINDNFIGFDPLTRQVIPTTYGFDLRAQGTAQAVDIRNNVIAVATQVSDAVSPVGYTTLFVNNRFGIDDTGTTLPGTFAGVRMMNSTWQLAFNEFANVGIAMLVDVANVRALGNTVRSSTAVLEYTTAPPIAPPAVTSATTGVISGTCIAGTTVDVFADPGVLAELSFGNTPCGGGAFSLSGTFPAGLNALATQSTMTSTSELSAPLLIQ